MKTVETLPQEIYDKSLKKINGISFSYREIEVIAGILLKEETKQISNIISIGDEENNSKTAFTYKIPEKTVFSHIDNIYKKLVSLDKKVERELRTLKKRDKIKFIVEHSDQKLVLETFCRALQIENAFLNQLEKIFHKQSQINEKTDIITCQIHCLQDDVRTSHILYKNFAKHLNQRKDKNETKGVVTIFKEGQWWKEKVAETDYLLYVVSEELASSFFKEGNQFNKVFDELLKKNLIHPGSVIFLLHDWQNKCSIPEQIKKIGYINFKKEKNYYITVFELLRKMLPSVSIEKEVEIFTSEYENLNPKKIIPFNRKLLIIGGICISALCVVLLMYLNSKNIKIARSELLTPAEEAFLKRPLLLSQMRDKLEKKRDNHTISLVGITGMGGAGKTTLARYYAKSHPASIVWEINAETKEAFLSSFNDLALALAKTREQNDELMFIKKEIRNPHEKEIQLLSFVKAKLKQYPNWLLIYDNVTKFAEIKAFFPHDPEVWGLGKVIITTTDSNLQNTNFVTSEDIIQIDKLSFKEALNLFCQILFNVEFIKLSPNQKEETSQFVKTLPYFPLDISWAAYYIKNTNITYEQYLQRIKENSEAFAESQEKLLRGVSDYTRTRLGIISLSFKELISNDPEFKELLFLISLLHSQDIPEEFLRFYKGNTIIDRFIFNLKRYSFINNDFLKEKGGLPSTFSIHRITQEVGLNFLSALLTTEETEELVGKFIKAMQDFLSKSQNKECKRNVLLIPHLESLLKKLDKIKVLGNLKEKYKAELSWSLGDSHYKCSGNFLNAKKYLSQIAELSSSNDFLKNELPLLFKNLGAICSILGDFKESIHYCHKSIELYRTLPNSHEALAENFQSLGETTYRYSSDIDKTAQYFKEALDKISHLSHELKKELEFEIYTQIAVIYSATYLNTDKEQKAYTYASKAIELLKNEELSFEKAKASKNQQFCTLTTGHMTLGHTYCRLGSYKGAKHYYNTAWKQGFENLPNSNEPNFNGCSDDILLKARILEGMGEIFLREKNFQEAEKRLTVTIEIFDRLLGSFSSLTARTLRAEAKIRSNNLKGAYKDCCEVFNAQKKEKDHYKSLMYLINFYHLAVIEYKQGHLKESAEHFSNFFKEIQKFSRSFHKEEVYKALEDRGIFREIVNPESFTLEAIKDCLQRSVEVFTTIYGSSHEFVQGYILTNLQDVTYDQKFPGNHHLD